MLLVLWLGREGPPCRPMKELQEERGSWEEDKCKGLAAGTSPSSTRGHDLSQRCGRWSGTCHQPPEPANSPPPSSNTNLPPPCGVSSSAVPHSHPGSHRGLEGLSLQPSAICCPNCSAWLSGGLAVPRPALPKRVPAPQGSSSPSPCSPETLQPLSGDRAGGRHLRGGEGMGRLCSSGQREGTRSQMQPGPRQHLPSCQRGTVSLCMRA